MMKRFSCWLFLFCFSLALVIPISHAEATLVSVRGVAKDGTVETALADAKRRAVYKTLCMIIREDTNPDSVFPRILANYERYIEGKLKPDAKKSGPQGLMVLVKVSVDNTAIAKDVKAMAGAQQDNHDDVSVYCLVRVTNAQNGDAVTATMARDFANAYKRLGFDCSAGDALPGYKEIVLSNAKQTAAEFENKLMENLKQKWLQVNVALIGEVNIYTEAKTESNCLKKAAVNVKAVDMNRGTVFAEFAEDYLRQGTTDEMTENLVVQKAAIDAAEMLAAETLKYWKHWES